MEKKVVDSGKIVSSLVFTWLGWGIVSYIIYKIGIEFVKNSTDSIIVLFIAAVILDIIVEILNWRLTNTSVFKNYGYLKNEVPSIIKKLFISFAIIMLLSVTINWFNVKSITKETIENDSSLKMYNYYATLLLDDEELDEYNKKIDEELSKVKKTVYVYSFGLEVCFLVVTCVMLYFEKKAIEKNAIE